MDLSRSLRSGAAGFCIHGPFCHFWLQWMEMNLSFGGAWWAVFPKVVADQTVWSIFLNTMYTSTIL
jgi:protein Mpv17